MRSWRSSTRRAPPLRRRTWRECVGLFGPFVSVLLLRLGPHPQAQDRPPAGCFFARRRTDPAKRRLLERLSGEASRLAALLLAQIRRVFSVVALHRGRTQGPG